MIPKKIHFTWFSDDPYPEKIKECMASWKRHMPDFEFIHWDMNRIKSIDSVFLHEALSVKKWAFASDFIRLWALYHEGGIYLDTDVLVYKSFEDLLDQECFIGKENALHIGWRITEQYLTSHCMGAVAGHPFIKECLDYYDGRHFIQSHNESLPQPLKYDMTIQPYIQYEIAKKYGYNPFPSANKVQHLSDNVTVYPMPYFDCLKRKSYSYCKHLAAGSWRPDRFQPGTAYKIKWYFGKFIEAALSPIGYVIVKKT